MRMKNLDLEEAKRQFKENNLKRLFAIFAIEIDLKTIDGERKPKKYIEVEQAAEGKVTMRFYPSLRSPIFYCEATVEEISIIVSHNKIANVILREINFVNPIDFNAPKRTIKGAPVREKSREFYYREKAYDTAIEMGICLYLGGHQVQVYELLKQLEFWAQRTYEGRRVAFSFIISPSQSATEPKINFIRFLGKNHAAVLTDGITSCIALDKDGNVIDYFCAEEIEKQQAKRVYPYAPYRFQNICSQCYGDRIGIILQSNGDILLFKDNKLFCARIEGKWQILNLAVVEHMLQVVLDESFHTPTIAQTQQIIFSLLDVSFAHSGGCLAIIDNTVEARALYEKDDFQNILTGEPNNSWTKEERERFVKIQTLQRIVGKDKKFYSLNRKLRQEIMALDGATIIDKSGTILATGAIIKVEGGSEEGGRLAATKALSKYGVAIKVSADGKIVAFQDLNEIFRIF